MKCKQCKREIAEGSTFCNWCGKKQVTDKQQGEISVPTPRKLPSGKYFIQLRVDGKSISITEESEELCKAKARAIKLGIIESKEKPVNKTVGSAIDEYIEARNNIISPTTLRSYKHIRKYRFPKLMDMNASSLTKNEVQNAINAEAKTIKSKTLKNAWGLVKAAISDYVKFDLSSIALPAKEPRIVNVYTKDELKKLFKVIEGDDAELAVLLATCLGLRRSEILGLKYSSFDKANGTVTIDRARVPNENNVLVEKNTKTFKSTRILPCPKFILDKVGEGDGYIYDNHKQNYLLERLKRICALNDLPDITLHGLRHTNASVMLALNIPDKYAMERGGWSSNQTMKNIYQHTVSEQRKKSDEVINKYFEQLKKDNNANEITNVPT
ncbi:MAG: tyrosine-type recombinase/integrase [Clostridiales bacterium]|nr:tyrosine-type recombinase/integrase [Clostridiales bacterium]